jgi:hypothetical protein
MERQDGELADSRLHPAALVTSHKLLVQGDH